MPSVGEQLKSAREAQGKSLDDIGSELKIRADHVAALEAGDFVKFDAPIFVRGFIRSYCRILKLDTNALVVQLNQDLGGTEFWLASRRSTCWWSTPRRPSAKNFSVATGAINFPARSTHRFKRIS